MCSILFCKCNIVSTYPTYHKTVIVTCMCSVVTLIQWLERINRSKMYRKCIFSRYFQTGLLSQEQLSTAFLTNSNRYARYVKVK